jgi:hypothetical protein
MKRSDSQRESPVNFDRPSDTIDIRHQCHQEFFSRGRAGLFNVFAGFKANGFPRPLYILPILFTVIFFEGSQNFRSFHACITAQFPLFADRLKLSE